ncbi:hypothetical protein IscW_ISCW020233 [Ixodes scapularis]|uniref:Uncharacterized protein n=1 Tax=Ixodes scapularis TaxID=6945 RepID=B7Q1M6_IXOSC|nr:hypothetical protein IscW_ISCW020233 [Ixodes scapularis]|eukprot:XP_002409840.1 hypothetical protein IscW_ISCW020233 [Ixodes scapularis]
MVAVLQAEVAREEVMAEALDGKREEVEALGGKPEVAEALEVAGKPVEVVALEAGLREEVVAPVVGKLEVALLPVAAMEAVGVWEEEPNMFT